MSKVVIHNQVVYTSGLVDLGGGSIEEQTKTIMLANVRPEYLFTVIDPPIIPERKTGPIRSQISIIGTILGAIFALIFQID